MKLRKYTIALLVAGALTTLGAVAADAGSPRPDFKLKCRNGRYDAKVWLTPSLKVENKCATGLSSQWVEVLYEQTDEDMYIYNVSSRSDVQGHPEFQPRREGLRPPGNWSLLLRGRRPALPGHQLDHNGVPQGQHLAGDVSSR